MLRTTVIFSFVLFFAVNSQLAQAEELQIPKREPTKVSLGVILSDSGPAKRVSRSWYRGVQLGLKALKARGKTVIVRTEDAGSSASRTAKAYTKLVQDFKVDGVIGGSLDYLLERLVPLAKIHRIPIISPGVVEESLSDKAKDSLWIRTVSYSIERSQRPLNTFFAKHLTRTCAIVGGDSVTERKWREFFETQASVHGCSVILNREISFKNYRSQIVSAAIDISRAKPDVVILPIETSGAHILARELYRQGSFHLFLATPEFEFVFELPQAKDHFENFFVLYPEYFADDFYSLYYKEFGDKPSLYAAAGYDAVFLLYEATIRQQKLAEIVSNDTVMKDAMTLKTVKGGVLKDFREQDSKSE